MCDRVAVKNRRKHPSTSFDIALTGDFDNPVEME
jgi:hypothetical protein